MVAIEKGDRNSVKLKDEKKNKLNKCSTKSNRIYRAISDTEVLLRMINWNVIIIIKNFI